MPHAIHDDVIHSQSRLQRQSRTKSLPRELLQLTSQLPDLQDLYSQSQLSQSVHRQLHTISKSGAKIDRIVSLGLGSMLATKGQSRRLKQLTILLAIRDSLQRTRSNPIEVYAQDPTFTRLDEILLASLNIKILRTSSSSELGEAASFISSSTLVYSPFLTLEVYEKLITRLSTPIQYLFGDDFDALLRKWPKHSAEKKQVEGVLKAGLSRYQRRPMVEGGFWVERDDTFPMVIYIRTDRNRPEKTKARI